MESSLKGSVIPNKKSPEDISQIVEVLIAFVMPTIDTPLMY